MELNKKELSRSERNKIIKDVEIKLKKGEFPEKYSLDYYNDMWKFVRRAIKLTKWK